MSCAMSSLISSFTLAMLLIFFTLARCSKSNLASVLKGNAENIAEIRKLLNLMSIPIMNTTWRRTIEYYRSARPHWTAGTNDLNILSMIYNNIKGCGTWRKFLLKKTDKSISSAVWTWKCMTLSLWPLLFFHIFCNLCYPSASGLSFSNLLSLAPKKPWREDGNFRSCQESFRPDMTFKLSTFVLVKFHAIWENVGLRHSEFTLKHQSSKTHPICILQ